MVALAELLQIARKFSATLVTLSWVFGNRARNDCIQRRRDFVLKRGHRNRLHIHHLETDRLSAISLEWTKARNHAVENHADREQV